MTSSRMLGVRLFKKNPMVSSLPMVYPACLTKSSKSDMYWSTLGKCILHLSSSILALCCSCELERWSLNSCMKVSQTSYMSSFMRSRESIQVPISRTHAATCCPWSKVRVMDTLQMGELSPGTRALARK
jgi:hypothetical protein